MTGLKKTQIALLVFVLAFGITLFNTSNAFAANYDGTIKFHYLGNTNLVGFTSGDTALGMNGAPADPGVWLFKQYFLGWSDQPDYATNENAKIFFENQTVAEAFPEGLGATNDLYAVYAGISDLDNMTGVVEINKNYTPEEILLDTTIISYEELYPPDEVAGYKKVIGAYSENTEKYNLRLDSSFQLDKITALLVYRNPGGILTNSGQWHQGTIQGAQYSHVDIHASIDHRVDITNPVTLSFTSYNFKPSYILDTNYNLLESVGSSLVEGSPTSIFDVDLQGNKNFIFRTTIRHDGNPNNRLIATPEQVFEDMLLTATTQNAVSISKEVAESLSAIGDTLFFSGYIDGKVRAATFEQKLEPIYVKHHMLIGFANTNVIHEFVSGTTGKTLPIEVLNLLPENKFVAVGDIAEPTDFNPKTVTVTDGTWSFVSWNPTSVVVTGNESEDIKFIGTWTFEEKPVEGTIITHEFVSGTPGESLPVEVLNLLPSNKVASAGETVTPTDFDPKTVGLVNGTWSFVSWNPTSVVVTGNESEDIKFIGTWTFEEKPVEGTIITHEFVSGTPGESLPNEVLNLLPENKFVAVGDTAEPTDFNLNTVTVADGTWSFVSWNPTSVAVTGNESDDIKFTGTWTFEEKPVVGTIITHEFVSGTPGVTLPNEVLNLLPSNKVGSAGETVTPTDFEPKTVGLANGTWTFVSWNPASVEVTGNESEDIKFTGTWTFEASEIPVNPPIGPPAEPQNPVRPDPITTTIEPDPVPTTIPELNKQDHFQYMTGYPDGTFKPDQSMTRAELATMIARLLTKTMTPSENSTSSFSDMQTKHWYTPTVLLVEKNNIISGYPDNTFKPNRAMTRGEFVAMMVRFENLSPAQGNSFADVSENHWAKEPINQANEAGWIIDSPNGKFRPNAPITRAEVIAITNRILERNADHSFVDTNHTLIKQYRDLTSSYWAYYDIHEASNGHDYTKDSKGLETWTKIWNQ